jgi:hypothetical protein
MAKQGASSKPPLDEVMLAMDVVDTLRHSERLVERELDAGDRDQRLKERMREIYASQGIEVSDRILAEGVAALKEKRFSYKPAEAGLAVRLAHLYIDRAKWGKAALGALVVVMILVVGYQGFRIYESKQQQALTVAAQTTWQSILESGPSAEVKALGETIYAQAQGALERGDSGQAEEAVADLELLQRARVEHNAIVKEAKDKDAIAQADLDLSAGLTALSRGESAEAEAALSRLQALQARLAEEYELRIVSRPGEQSGIWRVSDRNPLGRNYYLIVEAVTPEGQLLEMPITSEEDGKTVTVKKWGVRVDGSTFERVRADSQDDGIIQNSGVALKQRGFLEPEYLMPVSGGAITRW